MRHFLIILVFTIAVITHVHSQEWHSPHGARLLIGEIATICGMVGSARFADTVRGQPTYINLGPAFPEHVFTIVIWGENRYKFTPKPEFTDGSLCVKGRIEDYKGIPQIVVTSPEQIW